MKKYIVLVGFILTIFYKETVATTPGGQAGSFLRLGLGARAIAMGTAYTGLARDGFAGYYNPASLPFMTQPELTFSFGHLSLDRRHNFIGFSTYLNPKSKHDVDKSDTNKLKAGFSIGWINAGVDNIDARNSDGQHVGMLSNTEHAFYFSFALRPIHFLAIGFSAKVVNNRFPNMINDSETLSASGFGMDFGIYSMPTEKLSIGIVLRDLKTKYTWNTEGLWERGTSTINRFPTLLRIGAAYQLPLRTILTADTEYNEEQGWRAYFGGEIPYRDLVVARAGYNSDRFTFGFGLNVKIWKYRGELSYAYDANSITPSAEQYFSWRFLF